MAAVKGYKHPGGKRLPLGIAALNAIYAQYKCNAKYRGRHFGLSKKQFYSLALSHCSYCGLEPSQVKKTPSGDYVKYNGIDRIDNNLGYTLSNCVSACCQCNFSKSNLTIEEWDTWLDRIFNYRKEAGF